MTAKIDWFGFAEGAAIDIRGNVTLVGFNPAVVSLDKFPSRVNLPFVLTLADEGDEEDLSPGQDLIIDVRLIDPLGNPVTGMQQTVPVGQKKHDQLPFTATLVFVAQIEFRRTGRYVATASVKVTDKKIELGAQRFIHVIQP